MKYVSLDLETTGLDPTKHVPIEFGIVVDDLNNPQPIEDLPSFSAFIGYDHDLVWNIGALKLFHSRVPEYDLAHKLHVNHVVGEIVNFLGCYMIDDFALKSKTLNLVTLIY